MGGIEISRQKRAGWRDYQEKMDGKAGSENPKAVGELLSFQIPRSANDRSADLVWLCCHASATTLLLIYVRNQTNTFRLNGSSTTHMFNKKVLIMFHTYRWRFTKFYKYDRPPINRRRIINMAWAGKRHWEVTNNLMPQSWHFILVAICKYIANYCELNDFRVGAKRLWVGAKRLWDGAKQPGARFSKPRKLFGPVKPKQNPESYDCKAVLFTYS